MTDPINLTQLRADINDSSGALIALPTRTRFISADDLLALIDTAEAAHEIANVGHRLMDDRSFLPLRRALARFTFGDTQP